MPRQINEAGLNFIKSFESCSLKPYLDSANIPTQGWGHTEDVEIDDPTITQSQADQWLEDDLQNAESDVERLITQPLTDNQFAALVSLVYNAGNAPLLGHLGEYLNAGLYDQAADAFLQWDHVNGRVLAGLTKRREAERQLFLTD
jgi:lysozyme